MTRTYDPDLDNVYVNRDGTIRWDGEQIGNVDKVDQAFWKLGRWRAEIGNPSRPEDWPPFRASYGRTRSEAVAGALEGVEVPE
jgi:hypothetical protein